MQTGNACHRENAEGDDREGPSSLVSLLILEDLKHNLNLERVFQDNNL